MTTPRPAAAPRAVLDTLSRQLARARRAGHALLAAAAAVPVLAGEPAAWPALAPAALALLVAAVWPPLAAGWARQAPRRWRRERQLLGVDLAAAVVLAALAPPAALAVRGGAAFVATAGGRWAFALFARQRAALRDARRRAVLCQRVLDELDAGVVLYGPDDRLELRNRRFREAFAGLAPLLERGTPFEALARAALQRDDLLQPTGDPEAWLAARLRERDAERHVTLRQRPDDRWERIVDRRLPDGRRLSFAADVTDLVRQRRALDAARQGEADARQRLVDAIEALPDAFVYYDADDRLVMCNQRYRETYAASADAMLPGASFESVLRHGLAAGQYPEAAGREEEWLATRLQRHRTPGAAFVQALAGGRWLRVQETRTRDGGLVGFRTDVTDLVQREQALAAANRALETTAAELAAREAQLAGIVESASDGILSIDTAQRVRLANPAARAMFGLPDDGAPFPLERLVPAASRAGHDRLVAGALASGAERLARSRRLLAQHADGHTFPIEITIARHSLAGETLVTAVLRDVTTVVEAERARADRIAAESAMRAKTDFIARLSHELRTPMNAVLGFLQLLERPGPAPTALQPQSLRAARHLSRLIDDLLDSTRIDAGAVQLQCVPVPLHEALRDAVELAREGSPRRDVQVELPPAAARPGLAVLAVLGDGLRLRQVVENLVTHAMRYSRPDGRVELRLAADEADPTRVALDIVDHGIGLTPEQAARLFEPFNRLGLRDGDVEGTGMGLVVARQLAGLMGGAIEAHGEAGHGTRMRLWLRRAGDPAPVAPPAAPAAAGVAATAGRTHRVLYVEDNPINAMLVREVLAELRGLQVEVQETGNAGLAAAARAVPDLVLLDMELPDLSGLDVLARLRAAPATRATPVLVLSANAMPDKLRRAREAGADGYLTKPLDLPAFLAEVDTLLQRTPA